MITASQQNDISDYAYLPEHIPQYVTAISHTEPFLIDDFLVHVKKDHLTFVGYPLKESFEEKRMRGVLDKGIKRFRPESVSLIAPSIPSSIHDCIHPPSDHYYRLELSSLSISQKLRNMLSRASRDLSVKKNRDFDEEHRKIVEAFLTTHPVDEATRFIFKRIGDYLSSSPAAWVFDARNSNNELVAFDVAEFTPIDYILYMFNFSSEALYVPGASDLLLSEVIQQAKTERRKYINLGLGINPGVTFFKKKWGAVAFLPYASCVYHPQRKENLEALYQKL
ncbi:MAG TPA: hypothetical protein VLZ10_06195 [Thermodesulfobacteriota bacterium]|nr:hypothetical protein [Thermodesulfobacteriota bacterium]